MKAKEFLALCWKHYLALETDFNQISRYVSFTSDNCNCYSIEFSKQYQAICSELDVMCKQYCELLDSGAKCENIIDYAKIITPKRPNIVHAEVLCEEYLLKPWIGWDKKSPSWWFYYNKVKHQRIDIGDDGRPYYKQANLQNTIDSLSALFVIELNMYKDLVIIEGDTVTKPPSPSHLLHYVDWEPNVIVLPGGLAFVP